MEIDRIKKDVEYLEKQRSEKQRLLANLEGRKQQILSSIKNLGINTYEDILPMLKDVREKREKVKEQLVTEHEKLKEWWA